LGHATAVLGVNTSAFLEAAIADTPCLSVVSDRHREGQVDRGHFQHLLAGRFIETVPDLETAAVALGDILDGDDHRREQRRRFVERFVRPLGIARPAGETTAEAILAVAATGPRGPEPVLRTRRGPPARGGVATPSPVEPELESSATVPALVEARASTAARGG
jgi:hypothetical protein